MKKSSVLEPVRTRGQKERTTEYKEVSSLRSKKFKEKEVERKGGY